MKKKKVIGSAAAAEKNTSAVSQSSPAISISHGLGKRCSPSDKQLISLAVI